jgi:hypothetical protein
MFILCLRRFEVPAARFGNVLRSIDPLATGKRPQSDNAIVLIANLANIIVDNLTDGLLDLGPSNSAFGQKPCVVSDDLFRDHIKAIGFHEGSRD